MKQGIICFENARFSVITENLIRCEYSESHSFLDAQTSFAACRRYNGCEYYVNPTYSAWKATRCTTASSAARSTD